MNMHHQTDDDKQSGTGGGCSVSFCIGIVLCLAITFAVTSVIVPSYKAGSHNTRQRKCGSNVRGIHQSLAVWANADMNDSPSALSHEPLNSVPPETETP